MDHDGQDEIGPASEPAPVVEPAIERKVVERHFGKDIRRASLAEFAAEVYKRPLEKRDDGTLKEPAPYLGIEKFHGHGDKFYRLIWIWGVTAWLAAEKTTPYRTKARALAAGAELAASMGCRFSEGTR